MIRAVNTRQPPTVLRDMSYGATGPQTGRASHPAPSTPLLSEGDGAAENAIPNELSGDRPAVDSDQAVADGSGSRTIWQRAKSFIDENIGLFFVFLAQMFGSIVCVQ